MILRELLLKFGLDVDAQSFNRGQTAADLFQLGLQKIVNLANEAVDKIVELAASGKEIKEAAQATGLTTTELQELRSAAARAGVDVESLNTGFFRLSRTVLAAKKGTGEQAEAFAKMGVKIKNADGTLRSSGDLLEDISDHFASMPDGIEKTGTAMELFGRSGARLIPLLNKGREGLAELRKEAFVFTPQQLDLMNDITLSIQSLGREAQKVWKMAIAPLLPAIDAVVKKFLAWKKSTTAIMAQRLEKFIGLVIKAFDKLVDILDYVTRHADDLKFMLGALGAGFALFKVQAIAAALATAAAWIVAAAPFIALGAAIAYVLLILNSFRRAAEGKDSVVGEWMKKINDWLNKDDGHEPWFIRITKDFLKLIRDTLAALEELQDAIDRYNPQAVDKRAGKNKGAIRADADRQTIESARRRAAMGLQLTDAESMALERAGVSGDSFSGRYSPSAAPAAPMMSQQNQIEINVSVPEGSTPDDQKRITKEAVEEALMSHYEEANSSLENP